MASEHRNSNEYINNQKWIDILLFWHSMLQVDSWSWGAIYSLCNWNSFCGGDIFCVNSTLHHHLNSKSLQRIDVWHRWWFSARAQVSVKTSNQETSPAIHSRRTLFSESKVEEYHHRSKHFETLFFQICWRFGSHGLSTRSVSLLRCSGEY